MTAACSVISTRAADSEHLEFFEKKVRPLLAEKCYECHGDKKQKGGLRLDSKDGWATGGDSGPALMPGDLEKSLLIKAVRYRDKDFRMPPKEKLSDEQIAVLEKWVELGAPDPRTATAMVAKAGGINIEEGRKHWAYQLPKKSTPPTVRDSAWPRNDIDRYILAKLEEKNLQPAPDADKATLARRVYFDLIGLPPTPEQIDEFVQDRSRDAYEKLVDRLLASPHFGERWGRHWLDVVRYAESVTLRGFVFKEAWRYRDYVIDTFNQDRPFNRFIVEQVGGDLLPYSSVEEHQRQMTATTFLALGNTNLEEQDKKQLDMDVVDEQLDTIGKAFLGQTIGCARCHDHKFDPIPTRDYYAMAGILRSAKAMEHANVSKWVERPLPMATQEEAAYQRHEAQVAALQESLKKAKAAVNRTALATIDKASPNRPAVLNIGDLPGVVVDDSQAKAVGEWQHSTYSKHFVGDGYLHDLNTGKGEKTLTFMPGTLKAGRYEVRLAYVPANNRATNVPVTIFSGDGEKTVVVNQQETPPIAGRFVSLGQYRFEQNGAGFVILSTEGTKGHVIADAVQFIPTEMLDGLANAATSDATRKPADDRKTAEARQANEEVKRLEAELKKLADAGPRRPMTMSVEEGEIGDTYVHIRGSVHNVGPKVSRGFLQVASYAPAPVIPESQSGRREFGEWLASNDNPLTARVMANRVWHWLFGVGLVRTVDNFGTTGETPSHPELLDYLAVNFMQHGWSVKQLVREVMMSRTYQLAGAGGDAALKADPDNRLWSHANRRRLEAESIRDTILSISGQLDLDMKGSNIQGNPSADYGYKQTSLRRSIYLPVFRNSLPEIFEAFDFADPSMVVGRRNVSTVAPQALFLMNHPFMREQSQHAAKLALGWSNMDDKDRVERAYRLALGRLPTDGELNVALKYLSGAKGDAKHLEAWTEFYHALFASMDFRHVN
ncbi:MAG: DUF1553 domain-containing protein [Verrucomicrobiota bacterium]